ncbi:hypothetical protein CW736_02160 [Nonlabens sp. MB-3u-79]|nr:hypothetical protein CW736_02160 [Nonlabens sp. MB-3u-79]
MKFDNCNTDFKYFVLLKSLWFGYLNIKCQQCDTIFEHKIFNRLLEGLIILGSPLTINLILEQKTILNVISGFILVSVFFLINHAVYNEVQSIEIKKLDLKPT